MTLYSPSRIAKHTQNLLCKTFLTWLIKYSCNMWMATSNFFLGLQQEECGFQISNESFISWDNWTFSIICLFDSKLLVFISLFLKFTFLFHFLPNKQNKITFFFFLKLTFFFLSVANHFHYLKNLIIFPHYVTNLLITICKYGVLSKNNFTCQNSFYLLNLLFIECK